MSAKGTIMRVARDVDHFGRVFMAGRIKTRAAAGMRVRAAADSGGRAVKRGTAATVPPQGFNRGVEPRVPPSSTG
jgi:hypothetical protein